MQFFERDGPGQEWKLSVDAENVITWEKLQEKIHFCRKCQKVECSDHLGEEYLKVDDTVSQENFFLTRFYNSYKKKDESKRHVSDGLWRLEREMSSRINELWLSNGSASSLVEKPPSIKGVTNSFLHDSLLSNLENS